MTTGWLVGVLVETDGGFVRHFYAAAREDQARAEWSAGDRAQNEGTVATSPRGGTEPVQAISPLSADAVRSLDLAPGEVRALGVRWPRRWVGNRLLPHRD